MILDEDLALLYGVPTRILNQAVKRNLKRFPEDFMIELTRDEALVLRSQTVTLKIKGSGRGRKYLPLAFTEQGVAMLSGMLNSDRAVHVNIAIMRTFVSLRQAVVAETGLSARMKNAETVIAAHDRVLTEHAVHFNQVFVEFHRLKRP